MLDAARVDVSVTEADSMVIVAVRELVLEAIWPAETLEDASVLGEGSVLNAVDDVGVHRELVEAVKGRLDVPRLLSFFVFTRDNIMLPHAWEGALQAIARPRLGLGVSTPLCKAPRLAIMPSGFHINFCQQDLYE